jgi:regulator of replication initiation timing
MFGWFKNRKIKELEERTEKSFSAVKNDISSVGKWIKHLDNQDKQLFDLMNSLKEDLASVRDEIGALREGVELAVENEKNKQVFKKWPVLNKQTGVEAVQKAVQTAVQTGNIHDILRSLSSNERLVVFTILNSEMKLSYEDIALLLGKDKSTIRGQINAIKQKSEGLIEEMSEKNGKKRVFIPEEIKQKLQKYAKVRSGGKRGKGDQNG